MSTCKTVLIVDDDKILLKAMGRILADMDIHIITTDSAVEALAICQDQEVAVLISDHRMPEMTGLTLLEKIQALNPATIRILITGDSDCPEISEAIRHDLIDTLLSKPWEFDEIIQAVSHGLSQYQRKTSKS